MSDQKPETRTVTIEREFPHGPEKLWRALTQPRLMEEWLLKNDFKPEVGHKFKLNGNWGVEMDCEVLAIEPRKSLTYTWNYPNDDPLYSLESVVTFTLTATETGTLLRVNQSGFSPDQKQAYGGAHAGWKGFLGNLEQLLGKLD